ncbi:molybdenum cofactor guanylyltransferase [Flavicella sediminum]|uniref:molybdenum cofactor guanylyltransferase n=1 Tax=Flavicella sediminum TaxID=2585141 RepID=UPI00112151F3|nr:molybdenum cofactor guanylyltransferase [Flavicella sediminum]
MKKHSKHTKITKRANGFFAPNELSFVGVKCGVISDLVLAIGAKLDAIAKVAYVDASHNKDLTAPTTDVHTFHTSGNFNFSGVISENKYNNPLHFAQYDLTCINGNHFEGKKQVVFLDPEKENSINKRLDQISDIQFFIKTSPEVAIFDCLLEKFPDCKNLPMFDLTDVEAIIAEVKKQVENNIPVVDGVVLAGGKSVRMGTDKGLLDYHGEPQRDFMVRLLESQGIETFVSVRGHQKIETHKTISDAFVGLGPFGAICSAFMKDPNKAYIVLATDLPFVNEALVQELLSKRNSKKIATAIKGKSKDFMEPLVTIWEPKAYPILLQYLAQGYSCPRKILINSDVEVVEVTDDLIQNINTPEEFEVAKKTVKKLSVKK